MSVFSVTVRMCVLHTDNVGSMSVFGVTVRLCDLIYGQCVYFTCGTKTKNPHHLLICKEIPNLTLTELLFDTN